MTDDDSCTLPPDLVLVLAQMRKNVKDLVSDQDPLELSGLSLSADDVFVLGYRAAIIDLEALTGRVQEDGVHLQ